MQSFVTVADSLPGFAVPEVKERLEKWNVKQGMTTHKFRFTTPFKKGDEQTLAAALADNAAVRDALGLAPSDDPLVVTPMRSSVVNLAFFDRLQEAGLVADAGYIRQMAEEMVDGVPINDHVRDVLINPESEHADLFSEADRLEFLFFIFTVLCVGGSMCQPDETWQPYLETTKALYRELVKVHKTAATGDIEVSSVVVMLKGRGLVNPASPFSFACLIIDPKLKHATIWRWERKSFW